MTHSDSVRPTHFGLTPEQRASFDLFGNPEYRPYWPDVKLTGPDGLKRSWTELVETYRSEHV